LFRRRPRRCCGQIIDEKWFEAARRGGLLAGQRPVGERYRRLYRRDPAPSSSAASIPRASRWPRAASGPNTAPVGPSSPRWEPSPDYIGGFAVTAGHGETAVAETLQDRRRRLFPPSLVPGPRRSPGRRPSPKPCTDGCAPRLWAYAPDEALPIADLIGEKYRGNPSPPPAIPRPSLTTPRSSALFRLLDAERATGIALTESFAMDPAVLGLGPVFRPSRIALFRGRQDRARPGGQLMPNARAGILVNPPEPVAGARS